MGFILAEANKKTADFLDKILKDIDNLDMTNSSEELKNKLISAMADRDAVKIVLVGQYSSGKSSIAKMLTGDESIEIAAGIATDTATSYHWNGIEIIDTPGIKTGIREEHDNITKQAIAEADMLIFVATYELFDDTLAMDFRNMAFEQNRANSMILVVNKMSKTADGNTKEQQNVLLEDLRNVIAPKSPEDFYISFIDAEYYLNSKNEPDKKTKAYYFDNSGEKQFVDTLNRFILEKSLIAKICRPLHKCREILNEIATGNDFIESGDGETAQDNKARLEEARRSFLKNMDDLANEVENNILDIGYRIRDQIYIGADPNGLQELQDNASKQIQQIHKDAVERIQEDLDTIVQHYDLQEIENNAYSPIPTVDDASFVTVEANASLEKNNDIMNMVKNASKPLTDIGTQLTSKTFADVGRELGYNNVFTRWLNKDIISKEFGIQRTLGNVFKYAGPILTVGLTIYDEYQRRQQDEKLNESRASVISTFSSQGAKSKQQIQHIATAIGNMLSQKIQECDNTLQLQQSIDSEKRLTLDKINSYQGEIDKLLKEIN